MRGLHLAALLLLSLPCASLPAQTQPQSPATATAATSAESDRLRATARDLLRSGSPEDTAKAADLLLKASQIDAANAATLRDDAERRNLEKPPTESWKTLVSTLIPIVSTLIVVGTLVFNIYQGHVTEREKVSDRAFQRDSDERKRLDQAMETLQRTGSISPSVVLVNTFTAEPYRSQARSIGRSVLPRVKDYNEFTELFAAVYEPLAEADVPAVLTLLRSVNENLRPSIVKAWTTGKEDLSVLSPDETTQYRLYAGEQRFLSEKIAAVLRQPHPTLQPLNLSSLNLYGADLKGADLRGANLNYAGWSFVDVEGADMSGITSFDSFETYDTPWWLAAKMAPPLLQHLQQRFPYTEGTLFNTRQPLSRAQYEADIRRLQSSAASSPPGRDA